uniref:Testis expressed 36 n=1 Tax=Stegastes partitus TaxID=144197 RepID=A0A3B4YX90_9TELE
MVKGGKRYSSMSNDGKWVRNSSLHYLSCNYECLDAVALQTSREYPFSAHDNKHALKDDISGAGLGLRKCLDDRSQHISHFCLCHVRANSSTEDRNLSVYRADFTGKAAVNVPTRARRFPRNHNQKSAEAALAQPGGQFMWFGQVDSDPSETLKVLAASNCEAPSKPQDIPTFKAQKESLREHSRERMQRRSHKEPILNTNFSLPGV